MSITDKFLSFMKLNDEDDYDDYDEEDEYEVPKRQPKASKRYDDDIDDYSKETVSRTAPRPKQVKPKVVPMRSKNGMEVCVIKPATIEDGRVITNTLLYVKNGILNNI